MPTRAPLRWAGGKQRHAKVLVPYLLAAQASRARYFEPFLGGGSVFFGLHPKRSVLSDLNSDLILFYETLRDYPVRLRRMAARLDTAGTAAAYNAARDEFNSGARGIRRAALFLFLNRTGFNGIWRVNRAGVYTVPFGFRRLSLLPEPEWLAWSYSLKNARLIAGDYRQALRLARAGAIVYLDPPYLDTSGRELFSRYTFAGFSVDDHIALRDEVHKLSNRNVNVLLTIRDDPTVRELYQDYKIDSTAVSTPVGATGGHRWASDLIIRNFA